MVLDFLGNDRDPDGELLVVTSATLADATQGMLTNAAGVWSFIPAPDFVGLAVISYTVRDQDGASASSTHSVTVELPPVIAPMPSPPAPVENGQSMWISSPGNNSLNVPSLPIATAPALHVLFAVAEANDQDGVFGSAALSANMNAPLAGEAAGQLPDGLAFEFAAPGSGPALYVQHAVRHLPVAADTGLFVQQVVRASQLESALRDATLAAHNSAAPGYSSLLDPFALGAPRPVGGAAQLSPNKDQLVHTSTAQATPAGARPDMMLDQTRDTASVQLDAVSDARALTVDTQQRLDAQTREGQLARPESPAKPRAALGFRAQLQGHASEPGRDRPVTRSSSAA